MDAYDIFKKLTKGLTFKRRVLGVNNVVSTIFCNSNLVYYYFLSFVLNVFQYFNFYFTSKFGLNTVLLLPY